MMANLIKALEAESYDEKFVATVLQISDRAVRNKLKGTSRFNYDEYTVLRKLLYKYNPDWLFAKEGEQKSA